jgi:hypothetical protein
MELHYFITKFDWFDYLNKKKRCFGFVPTSVLIVGIPALF